MNDRHRRIARLEAQMQKKQQSEETLTVTTEEIKQLTERLDAFKANFRVVLGKAFEIMGRTMIESGQKMQGKQLEEDRLVYG